MVTHINEVGVKARTIFGEVRSLGTRALERFYDGFQAALKDVDKDWKHSKSRERRNAFGKVQDVAKQLVVDKNDGGGVDNGITLSTFNSYVSKVKRALLYNVSLFIAERATNQELQKARNYVRDVLGAVAGTDREKMEQGYKWVKDQQIKEKARLKAEASKRGFQASSTSKPCFTLPDPNDYETKNDDDSDALLQAGITGILAWLQDRSLQPHLSKSLQSATVLRRVLGELVAFENQKTKDGGETKVAAVS